jgi:hypothetical protein
MIKTLKISENTHRKLKTHCAQHNLKLNEWAEQLLAMNLNYPVLIEILNSYEDIQHLQEKLLDAGDYSEIEIEKLKKQLTLLGDSRMVFVDAFKKQICHENKHLI